MSGLISAATARLRAALATVRGTSMLGHLSPYADAVETTQDEINQRTVRGPAGIAVFFAKNDLTN